MNSHSKLILSLLFLAAGFSEAAVRGNRYYKLVNAESNACLELAGKGTENGAKLQLGTCNGEAHQAFLARPFSGMMFVGRDSGRCIETSMVSTESGLQLEQNDCTDNNNQVFNLSAAAEGAYNLTSAFSGLCVEALGSGTPVVQANCDSSKKQEWKIIELDDQDDYPMPFIPKVEQRISSLSNSLCVDLKDHGTSAGTPVQQWECTGEGHQSFRIVKNGQGYSLQGKDSKLCLETRGSGNEITQGECRPERPQLVEFIPGEFGQHMIRFKHSKLCLEAPENNSDKGTLLRQAECVDTTNQEWQITQTSFENLTEPKILLDNSSETHAEVRLFNIPAKPERYFWNIYSNGISILTLQVTGDAVDLLSLGNYEGLELGVSAIVDGHLTESENRIKIDPIVIGPSYKETLVAKKEGLGLLGTPITRKINFTFETYMLGCKKKTVVSTSGVYTESECDFRKRPKDFSKNELEILKAAAITAFKTVMYPTNSGSYRVTECAVLDANMGHGKFVLAPGVSMEYTARNAAEVVNNQFDRWDLLGKIEDFNVHVRVNYAEKEEYVLGHSNLGQINADFSHEKVQNVDKNRFEIHMSRNWLPPAIDQKGTFTWTKDGVTTTSDTSLRYTSSILVHEMIHQMGISHTKDQNGDDFNDDFVYAMGRCARQNWESDFSWNDAAGF